MKTEQTNVALIILIVFLLCFGIVISTIHSSPTQDDSTESVSVVTQSNSTTSPIGTVTTLETTISSEVTAPTETESISTTAQITETTSTTTETPVESTITEIPIESTTTETPIESSTTEDTTESSTIEPVIPPIDADINAFEVEVINLINAVRVENGLPTLSLNVELCEVARAKAQDMHDKGYYSHTSPTYGSPFDMMKTFGITYLAAGENIAMGQNTPEFVVECWINSEGHRANILEKRFTQIGMGYVEEGHYWVQMFIG